MRADQMTEAEMREEIVSDLRLNMFVEAGAGAGKTTLIVARILNLLRNGADPSEIVAITFTNAAAEELRGRIIDRVAKKKENDAVLEQCFQRLDRMKISTIHSFCNVLLQEKGLSIGLPQGLELLEETENAKRKRTALNAYLRTLQKSEWETMEQLGDKEGMRRSIREDIVKIYEKIAELPKDTKIHSPGVPKSVDLKVEVKRIKEWMDGTTDGVNLAQRLLDALRRCVNQEKAQKKPWEVSTMEDLAGVWEGEFIGGAALAIKEYFDKADEEDTSEEAKLQRAACLGCKLLKNQFVKISKMKTPLEKDKVNAEMQALKEQIEKAMGKNLTEILTNADEKASDILGGIEKAKNKEQYYAHVLEHAIKARDRYREGRSPQEITNDQLLEQARDLVMLEGEKSVLPYFAKKYKHYFVDEFQDTDELQAAFIRRLATDPADATHTKLRDGALFVVGDPKQSIYRFRGAQPEVYFAEKKKMEETDAQSNAKVYELSDNYRSVGEVIEWVNTKFLEADPITPIIEDTDGDPNAQKTSGGYRSMRQKKSANSGDGILKGIYRFGNADAYRSIGLVTRTFKSKPDEKVEAFEYNDCEKEMIPEAVVKDAENVRDLILSLIYAQKENGENKWRITEYRETAPGQYEADSRAIRYDDFLLISRTKKKMSVYLEILQKSGIPVIMEGEEDLHSDRCLLIYLSLYRYLMNPKDRYSRVGAEEALRMSLHCTEEEKRERITEHLLECLVGDAGRMTPYGKALYLERQISILFDKGADVDHITARSSQSHIRQMIEAVFESMADHDNNVDIVTAMQDYVEKKLEHELSMERGANAVHFMNLHKTKGLEGNIVIMLDRRGSKEKSVGDYRHGKEYYPGFKDWSMVRKDANLEQRVKKENAAEFHRLEYVAVTRAKQAVIFMDVIKKNDLFAKARLGTPVTKDAESPSIKIHTKPDDTTYNYNIDAETDLQQDVQTAIPAVEALRSGNAEAPGDYRVASDDFPAGISVETCDTGKVVRKSPSREENGTSPTAAAAKKAAKENGRSAAKEIGEARLKRPIGNIMGNVLHRTMELLVGKCFAAQKTGPADTEKLIEESCRQAVAESAQEIRESGQGTEAQMEHFAHACAKAYTEYLADRWEQVDAIYPEVKFSYKAGTEADGAEVWMNGTADLILVMKDGSAQLIDYKSDNDYLLTDDEMGTALREKYAPQLSVYRDVIEKMLGIDGSRIQVGVISFSQKDVSGRTLPGETVRVRYTAMDAE